MRWFTGKIYIVTDTVPHWLNTSHPLIEVVDPRKIFPNPDDELPTLNGDAILASLHRIPGLPRYFIKFDDDMMLGVPTARADFFQAGLPRLIFERESLEGPVDGTQDLAMMNSTSKPMMYHTRRAFAARMPECQDSRAGLQRENFRIPRIAPVAFDREVLTEVVERWAEDFKVLRRMKLQRRSGYDVQAMYAWYCMIRSRCAALPQTYADSNARLVAVSDEGDGEVARSLRAMLLVLCIPPVFFTLDGAATKPNSKTTNMVYHRLLPKMFPGPCEFEKLALQR